MSRLRSRGVLRGWPKIFLAAGHLDGVTFLLNFSINLGGRRGGNS